MTSKRHHEDKSRSPESPRGSWAHIIVVLLLLGLAAALGFQQITNYDIWRNLAVGRWICDHGTFPTQEFFSFTEAGKSWTDYEWLAELAFWRAFQLGDMTGLAGYRALILWLLGVFLFLDFRNRYKAPGWTLLLAFIPALALSQFRLLVRPHLHSFLLAAVLIWWLGRAKGRRQIVGVGILSALWANLHAGHLGLLIVVLAIAGRLISKGRIGVMAAALCGLLINPYSWKILLPLVEIVSVQTTEKLLVAEWAPLVPREMPWFWVYLAASCGLLAVPGRKRRLWDGLLLLVFTLLSLKSVRMVAYVFLLAVPGNAEGLFLLVRKLPSRRMSMALGSLAACLVLVTILVYQPLSAGIAEQNYPKAAADYVIEKNLPTRCLNDMHQGSYLEWRWYPERRVYMDGRTELFADLASMERAACEDVSSWHYFIQGFDIKGAILDYPRLWRGATTSTLYPLFRFLGWRVVAWDDGGVLLLAPGDDREICFARDGYRMLDPYVLEPKAGSFTVDEREQFIREINRAMGEIPFSTRARYIAGNFHASAHRPATALTFYEEIGPNDPDIHARKALALEKQGKIEDACAEWQSQLTRGLDREMVWFHLGRLSLLAGEREEAVKYLERALRSETPPPGAQALLAQARKVNADSVAARQLADLRKQGTLLAHRALPLMAQARWQEAQQMLEQAVAHAPMAPEIHQNLGVTLASQELWEQAEAEIREALRQDPSLGWAHYNLAGLLVTARGDTVAALDHLHHVLLTASDSTLVLLSRNFLSELD